MLAYLLLQMTAGSICKQGTRGSRAVTRFELFMSIFRVPIYFHRGLWQPLFAPPCSSLQGPEIKRSSILNKLGTIGGRFSYKEPHVGYDTWQSVDDWADVPLIFSLCHRNNPLPLCGVENTATDTLIWVIDASFSKVSINLPRFNFLWLLIHEVF